ncbi:MAG: Plasmid stabilization system [Candidatus Magasanikbacteria bacterium]|nr:Plasmid stabilization system [Candidatus Magasanikbacteria bacterium]
MQINSSSRFDRQYSKMEPRLQKLVKQRLEILKNDPFDPRLGSHKLQGWLKNYYSFRVDYKNRVIFKFEDSSILLFSVGQHDIYD